MRAPTILHPATHQPIEGATIPRLSPDEFNGTAAHYSKQWGEETGYTDFIRNAPNAATHTLARQLGWPDLFDRIRADASQRETMVYDAACGFGLIHRDLFAEPKPRHLAYVGADIHDRLSSIENPDPSARFVNFDISAPLPTPDRFDYVICRAALHHTPVPERTLRSFVSVLKPSGTVAISVYTKKSPMREASDEAFRSAITPLPPDEAFRLVRQFSKLGRDLQASEGSIVIADDLPALGIRAGHYSIQEFVYDHFLKCWFNEKFGEKWSDIVNFDWYHPPYAYRYSFDEIVDMSRRCGLEVVRCESNKAQHYLELKLISSGS